jgi:hypothetical protein
MSELSTLHPFDPAFVARYVAAVQGHMTAEELLPAAPTWAEREIERARIGYTRAAAGSEAGANAVSYGLARMLAAAEPVFFLPGMGFTQLEAKYDRGIGMLLRPPSRLFGDAGLALSRRGPCRFASMRREALWVAPTCPRRSSLASVICSSSAWTVWRAAWPRPELDSPRWSGSCSRSPRMPRIAEWD